LYLPVLIIFFFLYKCDLQITGQGFHIGVSHTLVYTLNAVLIFSLIKWNFEHVV